MTEQGRSISVLIVDDQADIRLLVRTLITVADRDLEVAGEAASGPDALACLEEREATVVVLDHMMPGMSGIETARHLMARDARQRIVLFSAFLDDAVKAEAAEIGIVSCLDKGDLDRLVPAVRAAVA